MFFACSRRNWFLWRYLVLFVWDRSQNPLGLFFDNQAQHNFHFNKYFHFNKHSPETGTKGRSYGPEYRAKNLLLVPVSGDNSPLPFPKRVETKVRRDNGVFERAFTRLKRKENFR